MLDALPLERDRAYRGLMDMIVSGGIDPSAPLSERKLADTLEVGRTPMREALRDLARDGVLEVWPARGTFVRQLSLIDVQEIYEVRYSLEGSAAFLAAERGSSPALRAYGANFRSMIIGELAENPSEIYDTGAEFHTEIFRAARNKQLLQVYEPIRLRFRIAFERPRYYDHTRVRETVGEHLEILNAIEAGKGDAARKLICAHLTKGLEARMALLKRQAKPNIPAPFLKRARALA